MSNAFTIPAKGIQIRQQSEKQMRNNMTQKTSIPHGTLSFRLRTWPTDMALTKPARKQERKAKAATQANG